MIELKAGDGDGYLKIEGDPEDTMLEMLVIVKVFYAWLKKENKQIAHIFKKMLRKKFDLIETIPLQDIEIRKE